MKVHEKKNAETGRVDGCFSAFGRIVLIAVGLFFGAIGAIAWFLADMVVVYLLAIVLLLLAGYFFFSATVAYQTHGKEVLLELMGEFLQAVINLFCR